VNREDFLDRVHRAVEQGRLYRIAKGNLPADAGYVGAPNDLCSALAAEVQSIGGESTVVPDWESARETIVQLLRRYSTRSAICWHHPTLDRLGLQDLLASQAITPHDNRDLSQLPEDQQRYIILHADVGISSVDFAVAETGTLAVGARPGQERSVSLVPPVHIAVVEQQQIVPDLFDLFAKLAQRELPSNVAFISGPSKTGDIELELTTGVHGPGKWHVVIVREDSSPLPQNNRSDGRTH